MEFTGRLKGISKDLVKGEFFITVSFKKNSLKEYKELDGKEVDIKIDRHKNKRSRNANAYFHVLVSKMADALGTSTAYVKNQLLRKYGQYEIIHDRIWEIIMRDDIDVNELEHIHLAPTTKSIINKNGVVFRSYMVIAGSHTYDRIQMSHLIENTIKEAKELGIETASTEEISRMEKKWGSKFEKRTANSENLSYVRQ